MKHRKFFLAAGLVALSSPLASSQSIGLNFGSSRADASLDPSVTAGVVPQSNWNNLASSSGGPLALLDSAGVSTSAEVTWVADEVWSVGGVPLDGDGTLLNGFFSENNNGGDDSSISVTGIPYSLYDLYLYLSHDRGSEDVVLSEASGAFATFTAVENDTLITESVTWVRQTESGVGRGNYVYFPALSRSDLKVILTAVDLGAGTLDRNAISGMQIVNVTPGDSDGDGLDDAWEASFGLDPDDNGLNPNNNGVAGNPDNGAEGDPDNDGSPNSRELLQGSSPVDEDGDNDTLLDGVETGTGLWNGMDDRGTSPTKADSDGDGLSDAVESNTGVLVDPLTDSGTDPNKADTDLDGLRDDWEIANGLSPFDNGGIDGKNGAMGDPDNDQSTNEEEQSRRTDPNDNDSDDDTLLDGVETNDGIFVDVNATGTDPLKADTDGDFLSDGAEIEIHGTDPLLRDSDGDFLRDDWELARGSDPTQPGDNTLLSAGIGINFGAGRTDASLAETDVAGVFPQAGWNNLAGPFIAPVSLLDDAGAISGAMIEVSMDEEWSVAGPAADPNGILLTGWFAAQNVDGTNRINITDIPFANYDLVLYFNHDRNNETADISEVNGAFPTFTVRENNTDILNEVTFSQQVASNAVETNDTGNFAIIPGLSASTLNLVVNAGTIGADRGPLNGLQLINRGASGTEITKIELDRAAGTVTLTWTASAGRNYSIDESIDLTEGSWLEIADEIAATGSEMTYTIAGVNFSTDHQLFYRVRPVQ